MLEGKAVQSMSRRGNCYDNAVIESFFAILKSECFYSHTYHSIAELQAEIEEYLVYYNQKRIKLGLKGLSPVQYRAQYLSQLTCPTFWGQISLQKNIASFDSVVALLAAIVICSTGIASWKQKKVPIGAY